MTTNHQTAIIRRHHGLIKNLTGGVRSNRNNRRMLKHAVFRDEPQDSDGFKSGAD